ncbi:eIF-2B GDP-GTP exchange factor [Trypanosoma brucei gambiense DAL972]|uniref:Translation initiation factor eIF2B subunit delta n=1 Tax=Trypanosoma brucei gambiense (strain MHOM/CI/86/DAL972) TaxID=679716 RepID=D0A5X8_TRYB9|nr:eIF-2B GDP-GTP exchange factor [Trypanosoma brucei gambiense DAL972]CBH17079.1 eIF-2B GDP-GTP exchange factor [Trypanosoma brucei gambiense DAL972]|eukprot:XP_011779343.1 eIF-2B GDP-GTP exchange factor [Trypanosoma brucei gambiense DAL972]
MSSAVGAAMSLIGQDSDEARAAVRLQRELKRRKDALRKLEKKMKALKPSDTVFQVTMEEMEKLKNEVDQLEKGVASQQEEKKSSVESKSPRRGTSAAPRLVGSPRKDPLKSLTPRGAGVKTPKALSTPRIRRDLAPSAHTSRQKAVSKEERRAGYVTDDLGERVAVTVSAGTAGSQMRDEQLFVDVQAVVQEHIDRSVTGSPCAIVSPRNDIDCEGVHYQVAELALMMESMMVVGGNARTFAMIEAFKALLKSSPTLSGSTVNHFPSKEFESLIKVNFDFLCRSRAPSAGMTNAKDSLVRRVVALLSQREKARFSADDLFASLRSARLESSMCVQSTAVGRDRNETCFLDISPRDLALKVLGAIERELQLSIKSIVEDRAEPHLSSNDTILVFGRSSTVELILLAAANNPRLVSKPKVIVVDSAPLYEGRALATRLSCSGLDVTYGLITTCCTLMPRCTRVFIGAAAVLQNGDVFSRCGTAVVVSSAKQFRKPVLCFSESIKFVPEVWLGNLGQNTRLTDMRQPHRGELRIRSPGNWSPLSHGSRELMDVKKGWGQCNSGGLSGRGTNEEPSRLLQTDAPPSSGYLYDLTPAAYIDMIICEMGCLHTSAILAALRDREDRDLYLMSAT